MKKLCNILLIIILCVIDALSKNYILNNFNVGESKTIISNFFKLIFIKNTGISFGMLKNMKIVIIVISVIIIAYMLYEFIKSKSNLHLFSVTLIISGALGNLIDRIVRGYVIDFLSFTVFGRELSVFNVADICVTLGVFLYIINMFKGEYDEEDSGSEE